MSDLEEVGAARTIACLVVGAVLWLGWGAVGGVAQLRIEAGSYLLLVVAAGALFELLWPTRQHLRTGTLLVIPGVVALVGPGDFPDFEWWALTLVLAAWGAASAHWLVAEAREWKRMRRRRSRRQHS